MLSFRASAATLTLLVCVVALCTFSLDNGTDHVELEESQTGLLHKMAAREAGIIDLSACSQTFCSAQNSRLERRDAHKEYVQVQNDQLKLSRLQTSIHRLKRKLSESLAATQGSVTQESRSEEADKEVAKLQEESRELKLKLTVLSPCFSTLFLNFIFYRETRRDCFDRKQC